ncbi:MFS transporter [Streptococcus sp. X13SY08]|uniref:MFS transporter n=1 Tax=Streptococcus sp. X13SY08 TaxID=1676616 RepID=UPI001364CA84|nr:MFS transporter [Streptococcus sp. X13SY08]
MMLLGHGNFWVYAVGMILSAWSYNFDSGTSAAMLFETVKEAGLESKFLKISSVMAGISEGTRTFGTVVAGFLIHGLLDVACMIQIAFSLLVMVFIFFMREPQFKQEQEEAIPLKKILLTVSQTFREDPRLLSWLISTQLLSVVMCMFYFYYQNELQMLSSWQIRGSIKKRPLFFPFW